MSHIFIKNLQGQKTARYPVWIMRQAGRYLPEYRKIRNTVPTFMSLCKNPELATEVTLQPLKRFKLDAAIIFSDILTIPDAMNLGLNFVPGKGPIFNNPIKTSKDIYNISNDVTADLEYVASAIQLTKKELNGSVPLIGFSGSPWTLAAYMIEGSGSVDFKKTCTLAQQNPNLMHILLECLTQNVINYCQMQINAGAEAIMLFDSHGNKLFGKQYTDMSLAYLTKIIKALKATNPLIPTIVYGKAEDERTLQLAHTNACTIGVSHLANLSRVRKLLPKTITLQGNIDPDLMSKPSTSDIEYATKKCIEAHHNLPGVINLGHGIKPDARIENVQALIEIINKT